MGLDGPRRHGDGEEEQIALGFVAEVVERGGFGGDELLEVGGEEGALRGPGPAGVGADDVDQGFCVDVGILEGEGEEKEACGVARYGGV